MFCVICSSVIKVNVFLLFVLSCYFGSAIGNNHGVERCGHWSVFNIETIMIFAVSNSSQMDVGFPLIKTSSLVIASKPDRGIVLDELATAHRESRTSITPDKGKLLDELATAMPESRTSTPLLQSVS